MHTDRKCVYFSRKASRKRQEFPDAFQYAYPVDCVVQSATQITVDYSMRNVAQNVTQIAVDYSMRNLAQNVTQIAVNNGMHNVTQSNCNCDIMKYA